MKPFWKNDKYVAVHSGIPIDYYLTPIESVPLDQLLFNRYKFINTNQLFLNHYIIIFGHTGFYSPYVDKCKIGIDTAACFLEDQPLTAFCPELNTFIDSNEKRLKINMYSSNYCPNIVRVKPWRDDDFL